MSKKIIALFIAALLLLGSVGFAEDLTSLIGWNIGGDTKGPFTGWVADLWATKGLKLEGIGAADNQEKMQAMLASGDLPDIIRFNKWEDYEMAVEAGYLLCLDDHLDKLPNTTKWVPDALQYLRDAHSAKTGKLYGTPDRVGPNSFATDAGCYAFNVRWDVYAKAGYPQAKTLEDMVGVFKAMKEVYPTNEDGLPTYALNMFAEWDGGNRFSFANAVLCTLGYNEKGQDYFLDYFIPTKTANSIFDDNSAFKRACKFLYTLNQEGLVDPDALTQQYTTSQSKIANGQYMGCWWGGYSSAFDSLEKKNSEPPVGFAPVMFDEYIASTMGNYYVGTSWPLCISAKAKNIDACLAYVDANADPEFLYQLYAGPKGTFWDIDAEGKTYATPAYYDYVTNGTYILPSGEEFKGCNAVYTLRESFLYETAGIDPTYYEQQKTFTKSNKLMTAWSDFYGGEYEFPIDKLLAEDRIALRPLALVSFLPPMDDDIKLIKDAVGAVVQQGGWKLVYAANDAEFETIWAQMVSDAKGLGVEQLQTWALAQIDHAYELAAKYE